MKRLCPKRILLLAPLFLALVTHHCLAGVQQAWVNRYSLLSDKTNQATAVALSADGNLVVGGSSASTNGDLDYLIIKYAPNGNQIWQARYDSPTNGNDFLRGMTVDKSGNAALTGTSKTAKFDTNGDLLWSAPYGGRAVAAGTNGNVYVTGFSEIDFATAKLNGATGSNVWTRTYDGIGKTNVSQLICVDGAENVFVSGFEHWACDQLQCYTAIHTFKYDLNGTQMWHTNQSSPLAFGAASASAIVADQFGNVYVSGNRYLDPPTYAAVKYNSQGQELWRWWMDRDGEDDYSFADCRGIATDEQGNAYLTGSRVTGSFCCADNAFCSAKLTNGHKAWLIEYHPTAGENKGTAIALDPAGNIYVTGYSPSTNSGKDIVTIKYDNNGNQLWLQHYDGPAHGDDIATGIIVDNETNIYVTGYSATTNGGTEFVTIKYSQKPALNIEKQPDGSMRLKIFADSGQLWGFQTTTSFLQDWQTIGTNTTDTNGVAQFDDTNTPPFPPRFYRGVSPPLP